MPIIINALGNKIIVGIMGLFVLLNIGLIERDANINANIYDYNNNVFYGELIIDSNIFPLFVEVESENKTINENKNEKVVDDKTPGKVKIKVKDERGREVLYERDMGSGEMSEVDKSINKEVADALTNYINGIRGKTISESIVEIVKGFANYCNKDSSVNKRWIDKRFSKK